MTGWLFISLSAATSVLIAHFLKVTESRSLNTVRVLTINYLVAASAALLFALGRGFPESDIEQLTQPILLSMGVGFVFIANFFIYSKSVYHNGVGISIASMRISLIIPVLLSTIWYLELLSIHQWVGVLLVFVTLFSLLPSRKSLLKESMNAGWLLLLLFVGTGLGDASLKFYEMEYSHIISKELFMGGVFTTSFWIGVIYITWRKSWNFTKKEILLGIAIGIPNLLTSIFLISALELMNGAIVYSSVNVLTVLGGTILGVIRWKDRFTTLQWAGLLLTLVSITLLVL